MSGACLGGRRRGTRVRRARARRACPLRAAPPSHGTRTLQTGWDDDCSRRRLWTRRRVSTWRDPASAFILSGRTRDGAATIARRREPREAVLVHGTG